jgi:hypothetical protein
MFDDHRSKHNILDYGFMRKKVVTLEHHADFCAKLVYGIHHQLVRFLPGCA